MVFLSIMRHSRKHHLKSVATEISHRCWFCSGGNTDIKTVEAQEVISPLFPCPVAVR